MLLLRIKLITPEDTTVEELHQEPTGKHGEMNQLVDFMDQTELLESKTLHQWTHMVKKLFTPATLLETELPTLSVEPTPDEEGFTLKLFGRHIFKK